MYSHRRPASSRGVRSTAAAATAPRRVRRTTVDDSYDPRDEFNASTLDDLGDNEDGGYMMDDRDLLSMQDHTHDKENEEEDPVHSVPIIEGRATLFDYLDYGAYINRVTNSTIDWHFKHGRDGQNVVNLLLLLLEERQSMNKLLENARESLEQLKHENKRQSLAARELRRDLTEALSTKDIYQSKCESMTEKWRKEKTALESRVSQMEKKVDELRHSNKLHKVDKRKMDQKCESLKEKVRSLLDNRDKRVMKGLSITGPMLMSSSAKKGSSHMMRSRESLMEECGLLSNDNNHLSEQLSDLLGENERLRAILMRLERKCTDELSDLIAQFNIEDSSRITGHSSGSPLISKEALLRMDQSKYGLPLDLSEPRIIRDIENKMDSIQSAVHQRRERSQRMSQPKRAVSSSSSSSSVPSRFRR